MGPSATARLADPGWERGAGMPDSGTSKESSTATTPSTRGKRPASGRPLRGSVLVVDDVKMLCEGLVRLLRQSSFEGTVAHSVDEALQLVGRRRFDVVITDVMMPGASGADLVEVLARTHPSLKCIVMTGYATKALIDRLSTARNVVDILAKPLNTRRLIDRISLLVGEGGTAPPDPGAAPGPEPESSIAPG